MKKVLFKNLAIYVSLVSLFILSCLPIETQGADRSFDASNYSLQPCNSEPLLFFDSFTIGSSGERLIPIERLLSDLGFIMDFSSLNSEKLLLYKENQYILSIVDTQTDLRKVPYENTLCSLDDGIYYSSIFEEYSYRNGFAINSLQLDTLETISYADNHPNAYFEDRGTVLLSCHPRTQGRFFCLPFAL